MPSHVFLEMTKPLFAEWMLYDTMGVNQEKIRTLLRFVDGAELRAALAGPIEVACARKKLRHAIHNVHDGDLMAFDEVFHAWDLGCSEVRQQTMKSGLIVGLNPTEIIVVVNVDAIKSGGNVQEVIDDIMACVAMPAINYPWYTGRYNLQAARFVSKTRGDGLIKTRMRAKVDNPADECEYWPLVEAAFHSTVEWATLVKYDNIAKIGERFGII